MCSAPAPVARVFPCPCHPPERPPPTTYFPFSTLHPPLHAHHPHYRRPSPNACEEDIHRGFCHAPNTCRRRLSLAIPRPVGCLGAASPSPPVISPPPRPRQPSSHPVAVFSRAPRRRFPQPSRGRHHSAVSVDQNRGPCAERRLVALSSFFLCRQPGIARRSAHPRGGGGGEGPVALIHTVRMCFSQVHVRTLST